MKRAEKASGVDRAKIEKRIIALIKSAAPAQYRKRTILQSHHLQRDLGMDSLFLASLMAHFEEEFSLRLSDRDWTAYLGKINTVGDIIALAVEIIETQSRSVKGDEKVA